MCVTVANRSRQCAAGEELVGEDRVKSSQHATLHCMHRDLSDAVVHIPYTHVSSVCCIVLVPVRQMPQCKN